MTGQLPERDSIIFRENDLEIFLGDGDNHKLEKFSDCLFSEHYVEDL